MIFTCVCVEMLMNNKQIEDSKKYERWLHGYIYSRQIQVEEKNEW